VGHRISILEPGDALFDALVRLPERAEIGSQGGELLMQSGIPGAAAEKRDRRDEDEAANGLDSGGPRGDGR
jgi:hypothetical protein